jgi:hypothetical protein
MALRKTTSLVLFILSVFLFTLINVAADAKTSNKVPKPLNKTWAQVTGFRSAKFDMDEKKVMRSIGKDFKISRSKVKRSVHPVEKTTNLEITVPKLMAAGGNAKIGYLLGMRSKKLMQINVIWGLGADKNATTNEVVAVANLLRTHFIKKRYQEKHYLVNGQLNENTLVVFRGTDKKGRMILLVLTTQPHKDGEDKNTPKKAQLILSYKLNPGEPDVLTIKDGDF